LTQEAQQNNKITRYLLFPMTLFRSRHNEP
jgi:hypothetical protein